MNHFTILLIIFTILFVKITLVSSLPAKKPQSSILNAKRDTPKGKLISKNSKFTYFWVAFESDYESTETVTIETCDNKVLGEVNKDFADEMKVEGTGITKTGRVFNLGDCDCSSSSYSCFLELDKTKFPFGIAADGEPLTPFTTVAANDIPPETLLYIPKLDKMVLPNSKVHNGCVKADDQGYGFGKKHIDWFVARKSNYEILIEKYPFESASVYSGISSTGQKCSILDYT